ncbi:MAG: hypothetical protein AAF992_00780 [Bacteroidota bacterium]
MLKAQTLDTIRVKINQVLVLSDTIYIPTQDTLFVLSDTVQYKIQANPYFKSEVFYDSLKQKAQRNRITRELYKMLVRPPAPEVYESDVVVKSESYFQPYAGKTIRTIQVFHVPLLDGTVWDTTRLERTRLGEILDRVRISTRTPLVRKNVLFTEGDSVNAFQLADSERILRSLDFIEDARIYLLPDPRDESLVAVTIVIKDRFPWGVRANYGSLSRFDLNLINRNMLGTGNQLQVGWIHNQQEEPNNGYNIEFNSRFIGNTFTQIGFELADNWQGRKRIARVSKEFLSPEIKYGGEIVIGEEARRIQQTFLDSLYEGRINYQFQDVWVGRAFTLAGENNRRTIRAGLRFLNHHFLDRPEIKPDSNDRYHNRQFLLGSVSYQKLNFVKTRYILSYGITEDVPVGYSFGLQYGQDYAEFQNRTYWGGDVGLAQYFPSLGYALLTSEIGGFWNGRLFKSAIAKFRLGYFSPLIKMGRTRLRNFANIEYAITWDLAVPESLYLGNFIQGIDSRQAFGNNFMSVHLESVWFTPWYFYGFKFAPLALADFGFVKEGRGRNEGENYLHEVAGLGGGFRIRNESLVFRTLEVKATYFPITLPGSEPWSLEVSFSLPILFSEFSPFKPQIVGLD